MATRQQSEVTRNASGSSPPQAKTVARFAVVDNRRAVMVSTETHHSRGFTRRAGEVNITQGGSWGVLDRYTGITTPFPTRNAAQRFVKDAAHPSALSAVGVM